MKIQIQRQKSKRKKLPPSRLSLILRLSLRTDFCVVHFALILFICFLTQLLSVAIASFSRNLAALVNNCEVSGFCKFTFLSFDLLCGFFVFLEFLIIDRLLGDLLEVDTRENASGSRSLFIT